MRTLIWIMCAIAGGVGIALLISQFSPQSEKFWVLPGVYASVFLLFYGVGSLVGFGVRFRLWQKQARNEMVRVSSRQGVLLGFMSVLILMLLAQNLFTWWSAALLLLIFILLELYAR